MPVPSPLLTNDNFAPLRSEPQVRVHGLKWRNANNIKVTNYMVCKSNNRSPLYFCACVCFIDISLLDCKVKWEICMRCCSLYKEGSIQNGKRLQRFVLLVRHQLAPLVHSHFIATGNAGFQVQLACGRKVKLHIYISGKEKSMINFFSVVYFY